MLGRKPSLRNEPILADFGPDETLNQSVDAVWVNELWVRRLLRVCALLSLVSVSVNTPRTFELFPQLEPVTFVIDTFVAFMFTAEMLAKIHIRGLIRGENPYICDHWCQFDASMVFFLWVSVTLQIFELSGLVQHHTYLSTLRFPRPLIMIRFIRVFLKFSMPKSRVNQILLRSSQQIYNVTLFFLFFMCLYALLGVQFFGRMNNHCVRNSTDPRRVTLNDLAIPDTYCSMTSDSGHQCPPGMKCVTLDPKLYGPYVVGFNGFDEFATSIFTVYEAGSQEGWVYAMYRAIDSLPGWRGLFYFTTLIFFLAWLVKNVFIAVIMETFNEIRVQFQQMWGTRGQISDERTAYVLTGCDTAWKLVAADETGLARRRRGMAPLLLQRAIQSAAYHLLVMATILANAYVSSSVQFKHDGRTARQLYGAIYPIEVGFTLFFDLEMLVKIWCMGWYTYWQRSIHKFEFILAIGSSLHLIDALYNSAFAYFQVLRIVRLIKASPILEDFVFKIFGPGKKLGSLIIFTMCLLIVASSVSMQLFCSMDFDKFETFPRAFMSMFQILTQEGWVDVMDETMWRTTKTAVPLVAVYFILYHLIVTLIVLSLFVAVILDNLELDENIKKLRQLRAREQSAGIQETLPLRIRIFEKFPDSPQMARLHTVPTEFTLQKVRDSFMRKFVGEICEIDETPGMKNSNGNRQVLAYKRHLVWKALTATQVACTSDWKHKHLGLVSLISDCNNHRLLLGDSGQLPTTGKPGLPQTKSRFETANCTVKRLVVSAFVSADCMAMVCWLLSSCRL